MSPNLSIIASGLRLLTFQGVTLHQGAFVVATLDGDLLRISPDGAIAPWVNVSRYGVPTGITSSGEAIEVVLSTQESGHFLVQVSSTNKISVVADLSQLAGEFGAPFGVAAHGGYYPYYLVSISTDVVGSGGLVARITPSGKVFELARITSTPFGIAALPDGAIATLEDGRVVQISLAGDVGAIANLVEANLGMPIGIALEQKHYLVSTTKGWLVQVQSDGTLTPLTNILEAGFGSPTAITCFQDTRIILTSAGNLLSMKQG